ncbi:MAG: 3'-5' exonuclease [Hyphomicrobiaceae bacterium]
MFGLDDDDLRRRQHRRGSLWSAMLAIWRHADHPVITPAVNSQTAHACSDTVPPYEFLVQVLVHDGMRHACSRVSVRKLPILPDELMSLALTYDDQAPPSLQGFVDWLKSSEREIKRDMEHGRNEVRVMTVHGSKGLEAPIVFLPDTCSAPYANRPGGLVDFPELPQPRDDLDPFLWPVKGSSGLETVRRARDWVRNRESEEHNRLLYVALTRARDRLYIAGYESVRGRAPGCWYDTIASLVDHEMTTGADVLGNPVRRISARADRGGQIAVPRAGVGDRARDAARLGDQAGKSKGGLFPRCSLNDCCRKSTVATPSSGSPRRGNPGGSPARTSPRAGGRQSLPAGTITHALLQHLPSVPREQWRTAADRFVAARNALAGGTRLSSVETLHVLTSSDFAPVFGPGSRAEVPIAAAIPHPDGRARRLRLAARLTVSSSPITKSSTSAISRPIASPDRSFSGCGGLRFAACRLSAGRCSSPFLDVNRARWPIWTDGLSLMELPIRAPGCCRKLTVYPQRKT